MLNKKIILILTILLILESIALIYTGKISVNALKTQQRQVSSAVNCCEVFTDTLDTVLKDKYIYQSDYTAVNRSLSEFLYIVTELTHAENKNIGYADVYSQINSLRDICIKMQPDANISDTIENSLTMFKSEEFLKLCKEYINEDSIETLDDLEKAMELLNNWCIENRPGLN